jgi:hypothetical protein
VAAGIGITVASGVGSDAVEEDSCCLYLAYSNVFGRPGVFTSTKLEKGTILNTQDIVVPLIEDEGPLWDDHRWSHLLGYVEWEGRAVRALFAGPGGAVNIHSSLYNIVPTPVIDLDHSTGLHRRKDPGAGAFSYQVMHYTVTSSIPAGGQILLQNVDAHRPITEADYDIMDAAVEKLDKSMVDIPENQRDSFLRNILGFVRSGMMASFADSFPATSTQFQRAKDLGVSKSWIYDDANVSPTWLKENGICLDNIQHGTSTLPQAGRGAFARRMLAKGSVVSPAPVIPVSRFKLEKSEDDEYQLLRNYCFGHFASSLLLCPYGSSAPYVNHANDSRVNVKLVWSTTLDSKHDLWSAASVDEILKHPEPGLVFNLVATKDIAAGDEIFLNYGNSWTEDWNRHAEWWEAPMEAHEYQSAIQLNQLHNESHIKTETEQAEDPYPHNVLVAVRYQIDRSVKPNNVEKQERVKVMTYPWKEPMGNTAGLTRPVHVVQRKRGVFGGETYIIELLNHPLTHTWNPQYVKKSERVLVTGVPREALHFVDAPYTSDHHLDNVFRSEIQIPDEIFPAAWVDLMEEGDLVEASFENHVEEL